MSRTRSRARRVSLQRLLDLLRALAGRRARWQAVQLVAHVAQVAEHEASGLLISCATPAVSVPSDAMRSVASSRSWACRSSSSASRRRCSWRKPSSTEQQVACSGFSSARVESS